MEIKFFFVSWFNMDNFLIQLNHNITKTIQVTFVESIMLTIGGHIYVNRV